MNRIFDYQRLNNKNRIDGSTFDLGNAGAFGEVRTRNCSPPEECLINGITFRSIHVILTNDNRIFTAYRSDEEPSILLIVWGKFPFYLHIEEGGDFMLQVMLTDKAVRHLIIDNSYVRSGWMDDRMNDYLNNGWIPGLIELQLENFFHLQADSYLGGLSFEKFGDLVSENVSSIAQRLGKKPFNYYPVKTSEISPDGKIEESVRSLALEKAVSIIKSSHKD